MVVGRVQHPPGTIIHRVYAQRHMRHLPLGLGDAHVQEVTLRECDGQSDAEDMDNQLNQEGRDRELSFWSTR